MNKYFKFLVLPLLISSISSCNTNTSEEGYKRGERIMLNDFESNRELSKLRILDANFSYKVKFGLNEDKKYVTHGEKSMYATASYGSTYTFQMFFDDVGVDADSRSDFKSVHIDVYNETSAVVPVTIALNMGDKNATLLRGDFEAKQVGWNSIDFDLSAIALEYNGSKVRGVAVSFVMPLNEVVYFDNFSIIAGAEYTQEDKANKSIIDQIAKQIDALPEFVAESDYNALNSIYEKYTSLSEIYRRIIPNFDVYTEKVNDYFLNFVVSKPLKADQPFLCNDEFYAIAQYSTMGGTDIELTVVDVPDNPEFASVESKKWLKIDFYSSANNMIIPNGVTARTIDYETMTTTIYNESDELLRIWFNYENMCYLDIAPHQLMHVELPTSKFNNAQGYWAVHHLSGPNLVSSRSACYMTPFILHRMADEEITEKMNHYLNRLPDPSSLVNEESIIRCLDDIHGARSYYDRAPQALKDGVSQTLMNRLIGCENATKGYGVIYASAQSRYQRWYPYGVDFTSTFYEDSEHGEVAKCTITEDPIHSEGNTLREHFFITIDSYGDTVTRDFARFRVDIFNPTDATIRAHFFDVKWANWASEQENCFVDIAPHSWGSLVCNTSYLEYNAGEHNLAFSIKSDAQMTGDFLISSVFGLPKK